MPVHRPRRPRSRTSLAALCCAAAVPWPALAVETDWKTAFGSGGWSTAFNWQQGAIPAAGDDAYIVHNDAINRVVTYDYTLGPITLGSVQLDNTGADPRFI